MKSKFVLFHIFLSCNFCGAQLVDVINELYFNSGGIGDIPEGYATYRIYARLEDPTDRISAVFGSDSPYPIHHLKIHSGAPGNSIYNSSFAGTLGTDNNCAFWGFFPAMPYDSYVTFQAIDSSTDPCPQCSPTGSIFQLSTPSGMIPGTFNTDPFGPDLTLVDGSWFIPNDGSCYGFPTGIDNRILIAQVTVPTGTLEYWLNIAIFNEAVGSDQMIYVHSMQEAPDFVGSIPEIDCCTCVYPSMGCDYIYGCIDLDACNYSPMVTTDDGSCTYPGCTDSFACNFIPTAGCDDGSCIYYSLGDLNCDSTVNISDLLIFLAAFGCVYDCGLSDLNGDGIVNILDLLIFQSVL